MEFEIQRNELDNKGYGLFENLIDEETLNSLKKIVDKNLEKNKDNSFFLTGENLEKDLSENTKLLDLIIQIFHFFSKKDGLKEFESRKIYKVLRVISKGKMYSNSYDFHFDAHHYTVLIPIYTPTSNEENYNGDLILMPNIRNKTNSIILNIIQKFFYQNKLTKVILKFLINKRIIKKSFKIKLKPGNAYVFNGFRSLHCNQVVKNGLKRATLLLHFYDLFENSKIINFNRQIRQSLENKNIKKNINT